MIFGDDFGVVIFLEMKYGDDFPGGLKYGDDFMLRATVQRPSERFSRPRVLGIGKRTI